MDVAASMEARTVSQEHKADAIPISLYRCEDGEVS